MAVTGNGSMAGNNQHVGNNSEKVRSQTEGYNQLDKGQGDDLAPIPVLIAVGAMLASDVRTANTPAPGENLDDIPQSVSLMPIDIGAEILKDATSNQYDAAIDLAVMVGNPIHLIKDGADVLNAVSGKLGKKDGGINVNNETMHNIINHDNNGTLLLENKHPNSNSPEHPDYPITAGSAVNGTRGWMVVETGQIDPITGQVNRPGSFLSETPVVSVDQARNELAIRSDWKKNPSHVQEYEIVSGTQVQRSTVGPQTEINGQVLSGGGRQIEVLLKGTNDRNNALIPIGKAEPIK